MNADISKWRPAKFELACLHSLGVSDGQRGQMVEMRVERILQS